MILEFFLRVHSQKEARRSNRNSVPEQATEYESSGVKIELMAD